MLTAFTPTGMEQYIWWQENDRKILKRINSLIKDITRHPFEGIGKPEMLKHDLKGCWSRRINDEHRIVYEVKEEIIIILACKLHYD